MSDFTYNKDKHIKCIIENFDFDKVHKVMEFLNWNWAFSVGVPTINEMQRTAKQLLNQVYESDSFYIATGGFKALKYDDHLELEFVVTDWTSEIINYGKEYEKKKKVKTRRKKLNTIQKIDKDENY